MCHQMDPSEVVPILNGYFQCMTEALSKHHGRVTELIGDGLLALFGALRSNPWQVQDAVMGALAMREALVPKLPVSQKSELKQRLKEAIANENYELASILRDELRMLGDA